MVRAIFTNHGALSSTEEFGLVGLNDIEIVQGAGGPMLFAATRGDGWLTAYRLGGGPGQTVLAQHWRIAPHLLQLETTDLVLRNLGGTQHLYLAGLNSSALTGVRLDSDGIGNAIDGAVSFTAAGRNLGGLSEMELVGTGSSGLGALRTGGLVNLSFGTGSVLTVTNIFQGSLMQGQRAHGIETAVHNGVTYAFVTYQGADAVSMFRQSSDGTFQHVNDVVASDGFWVDRPGALTVTSAADGRLYVVVAGSGSDSLSTFAETTGGMVPVDHLIDSLDTRFADASHVTSVMLNGHNFVLAAGSDRGVSLFTVLPGGRLQHIDAMPAAAQTPLQGITSIDAMATANGIRFWVSTEAAPYLSEFSIALPNIGVSLGANAVGGTLNGSVGDDVLAGGSGPDRLNGNFGNDILLDGAGQDTLHGGGGRDTFILVQDGVRDVILDFQLGFDRIDLTDFSQISGLGGMAILSQSWGAEIRIGTEVLEVRTADGSRLFASDFNSSNLITGNRIQTDPALFPGGTGDPRPDPNPGRMENPSGIDPETLAPKWINEPVFQLNRGPGDILGTAGPDLIQTGGQNDRIFGGAGNDTIQAGGGRDAVNGEGGNDSIDGGGESDFLLGGAGFDTINGGDGNDTIVGGDHADSLFGGNGNDLILGGDGFDQIYGGDGNDRIWAGSSPDRVFGGPGDDWLSAGSNFGTSVDAVFGEAGNDTIFGNAGFDLLRGGDGDDIIDGGHQADNIYGDDGNDTLLGDLGFDRLFGGRGDDMIYGGPDNDGLYGDAGFDTLIGGFGDDLLFGGFNADEFIFSDGHGNDTIADFDAFNGHEVLNFSGLSGLNRISDVLSAASQVGQDVVINTGGGNTIRLQGVEIGTLDASDFIF